MTLEEVVSRLDGVKKHSDRQYSARCPAHDDRTASLSVGLNGKGDIVLHCHAGCDKKIDLAMALSNLGIKMSDLFPGSDAAKAGGRGKLGKVVCTYLYRDLDGNVVYAKDRYEPKDFRLKRPDGKGGWIWKEAMKGVKQVLYHLPEIHKANPSEWILVVEGCKDADSAAKLGFTATCNAGGAGKWRQVDDSILHGRKVCVIPDRDEPGRKHANDIIRSLVGKVAELRLLKLAGPTDGPKKVKDLSDWIALKGDSTPEDLAADLLEDIENAPVITEPPPPEAGEAKGAKRSAAKNTDSDGGTPEDDGRLPVDVSAEPHAVVERSIAALQSDPGLFQRGCRLVRVLREEQPSGGNIARPTGSPTIATVPTTTFRERLSRVARFCEPTKDGTESPAKMPQWLPSAIADRGDYPLIRPLVGISSSPVLRPDGTVHQTPGYDAATGILSVASGDWPVIPDHPTIDDARRAADDLLEVVADFPFAGPAHRAAWLAAVLTPLARSAFSGPVPCFLFDANVRGSGKTLLALTAGRIVLGRDLPASAYTSDDDELRKRLLAIALAGDPMILLDNVADLFGGPSLDAALTGTTWRGRILGRSEEAEIPLRTTFFATGNNVQVAADTCRRIVPCRLDVLLERPEEREGFKHPDLLAWVASQRPRLLAAGLTILSAYLRAGAPPQGLKPMGSYDGWSAVVRSALTWIGLPDPAETRIELAATSDSVHDVLAGLLDAWGRYLAPGESVTASDLLNRLYSAGTVEDTATREMRDAVEAVCGVPPGRTPTPRQLGNRLRAYRRRVVGGSFIDLDAIRSKTKTSSWVLVTTGDKMAYGSDGSDGSFTTQSRETGFDNTHDAHDARDAHAHVIEGAEKHPSEPSDPQTLPGGPRLYPHNGQMLTHVELAETYRAEQAGIEPKHNGRTTLADRQNDQFPERGIRS